MPNEIYNVIINKYPNATFHHHSCSQIEEIALKNKLKENNTYIYINVSSDLFDFIYLKNGTIQLFNSFAYKTDTDFLYFILNAIDQLSIKTKAIPVIVSGLIDKNDGKIEALKKYTSTIRYQTKPNHFEYSFVFNEIPDHYFVHLLNLYQCV